MSRAVDFATVSATATCRAGLSSAPLPTALLLTTGSLPLPLRN